ncbi:hypothetical protein FQN60_018625 [Etheostoma spectabile]|uniref:Uncharacterized protein n=1 Tax=Etheostoma spectabile TaxID=54343 RepID=A0A5J5C6G2_9PERO|nr:hypothetical protein FQN60_018625 [Etheostoma spectabile]
MDLKVFLFRTLQTRRCFSQGQCGPECIAGVRPRGRDFSTNHQLPSLDFAENHRGQPDARHVRLHLHVRVGERGRGAAAPRAPAAGHAGGGQPAGALLANGDRDSSRFSGGVGFSLDDQPLESGSGSVDVLAGRESLYRLLPQRLQRISRRTSVFLQSTRRQDT